MEITLNGKKEKVASNITIDALIQSRQIDGRLTVVEVNKQIITQALYATTKLNKNDVVEILRFVGGG